MICKAIIMDKREIKTSKILAENLSKWAEKKLSQGHEIISFESVYGYHGKKTPHVILIIKWK